MPVRTGGTYQVILPQSLKRDDGEPVKLRGGKSKYKSKSEQRLMVDTVQYSPFYEESKKGRVNPLYEPRDFYEDE